MIHKFPRRREILIKINKAVGVALKMVCLLYYCNLLFLFLYYHFPNISNSFSKFSLRQLLYILFQIFYLKSDI